MASNHRESVPFRRRLVEILHRDGHLRSSRVAAALLAVPREVFVPGVPLDEVYRPSDAIVVKRLDGMSVSSASAPEVIALMLEQLDPRPGDHVLEIGAGTGYNAALLAHMVGSTGQVVTIDIDEDLVVSARQHLADAGFADVTVVQTDGAFGYAQAQPYNRLILTVASSDIAPAWREQLAPDGGRLVMPLSIRGLQRCVVFTTEPGQRYLRSNSPRGCSFISLRGMLGSSVAAPRARIDASAGWVLNGDDEQPPISSDVLGTLLTQPMSAKSTRVASTPDELRQSLQLWLAARAPNLYTLWSAAKLPDLFGLSERIGARGTLCLVDPSIPAVALLSWCDETPLGFELCVLAPPGSEMLAENLESLVAGWAAAGRPGDDQLEIRAFPRLSAPEAGPAEVAIDQRWTRFLLSWLL